MTLLDVNVLLALVDPLHAHHERAKHFSSIGTPRLGRLVPLWKTDFSVCFLALAVKRGGKLATFDPRINPAWVPGGAHALMVLDPQVP